MYADFRVRTRFNRVTILKVASNRTDEASLCKTESHDYFTQRPAQTTQYMAYSDQNKEKEKN
jgi:hypothetical protein